MTREARRTLLALALTPVGQSVPMTEEVREELTRLRYLKKDGTISGRGLNVADRLYQASAVDKSIAADLPPGS